MQTRGDEKSASWVGAGWRYIVLKGWRSPSVEPWNDKAAIRADLFGMERLEHHAISLAKAQVVEEHTLHVTPLSVRVRANSKVLLSVYKSSTQALQAGESVTPGTEWLLDNFHMVERQLQLIASELPPDYYRQLPKLSTGPLCGYPRVLGIAWAYVAHTDSLINGPVLARFVRAYQTVEPLTIGELWALAITLRIVLIENMRRLAEHSMENQELRRAADTLMDRVLNHANKNNFSTLSKTGYQAFADAVKSFDGSPLPEVLAARIAQRMRGFDTADTPLRGWVEDCLNQQGLTIDGVVQSTQNQQGASNVTMRNIVTSLRLISEMDWPDLFEEVSPVDALLRGASNFGEMDFASRNNYRTSIEILARGSDLTELEVANAALEFAAMGKTSSTRDPGHGLIGPGRKELEASIGYKPSIFLRLQRATSRLGLAGYLAAIGVLCLAVLGMALHQSGAQGWLFIVLAVGGLGPAFEAGNALVHLAVTRIVLPKRLPGIDLAKGIPSDLRCLVAVPVLLDSVTDVTACIERLEVHHLSSSSGAIHYAILSDGPDSDVETRPQDDALIAHATLAIARLNAAYPSPDGDRFLLLHRRRQWNPSMGVWMGWERKRGKLTELNRLLRGATDTSFLTPCEVPKGVRFVITLDADTRLLRDTVRRLVGKMAHPINRPYFDVEVGRVTRGYGILQPRVTPSLPVGIDGSIFQQINASQGGIDAYASAISDVYQDLFGEGSFTGKGIYDVDAFAAAMSGRVPDNTMLSHDLFEGNLARAGLVSDIEVIEDYPARHDIAARRQDRWVRGDWQLLPWLTGRAAKEHWRISSLGRWKIIDNLRRSLTAPLALLALAGGWLLPIHGAAVWTALVFVMLALPHLLPLPLALLPGRAGITAHSHLAALAADARTAFFRLALDIVFLADTAGRMCDAIVRTVWRLGVSRMNLLEWVTSAHSARGGRPGILGQYLEMKRGVVLGLAVTAVVMVINPSVWLLVLPFALVWLAGPLIAYNISQPIRIRVADRLSETDIQSLRLISRRTWRFFEAFVTPDHNYLPPDNFQETPKPVLAHRTSPTNIGLYLLATTAAHDFGWIGRTDAITRLEQTLATVSRMPRFRGHLYNWYDTKELRVLEPDYISSVDSGNLAGHLIAVAQTCVEWQQLQPKETDWRSGLDDTLLLIQKAIDLEMPIVDNELVDLLHRLSKAASEQGSLDRLLELSLAATNRSQLVLEGGSDISFWIDAAHTCLAGHAADRKMVPAHRIAAIEVLARELAMGMDFGFLLDRDKKLLSIGFSVTNNRLDQSCYDLLASEARLASLFAIAKGDVDTSHWFRLGRTATPMGSGSALISWSGSMFEYLMPSLVLRAPEGSLLTETNRKVVDRQRHYGNTLGIPWGISESSYNVRNLEMTYQYSNFGIPGLGMKRGLNEDRVVAPYASALAAMVAPVEALNNLMDLRALGAEGEFGFYEALDFTGTRLPSGAKFAIVRSFMAHHQGMTITAIANVILEGRLRTRFHSEPMIKAVELLLQERLPRDVSQFPIRAEEISVATPHMNKVPVVRQFLSPSMAMPTAHLLSNGAYGVSLTPTGAGQSTWRNFAVTRWRDDPTTAHHGSFIFARDRKIGSIWSSTVKPTQADTNYHSAVFSEHEAVFTHKSASLRTLTEIVVSSESDAEARRVTLTNSGRQPREIELTSYAELVLAPQAADVAHPAFSKLFVVTDFLPELGVLIATRRRRNPKDPEIWAAHIAVVEGEEVAPIQFETDRSRFIGQGKNIGMAASGGIPLSQTTGTVLDPIFAIRRSVIVPAGGMARVTFWTMVADNPDTLLDIVDRHRDPSAFGRAVTLAWTQAQVQLYHLGVTHTVASDFQRLGGMLIRADPRLRASEATINEGAAPQSSLWPLGISGDLPIVLFRIDDTEDAPHLLEVLAAHEYLRMRKLAFDIVILNDRAASYVQELQTLIESSVRSAGARPQNDQPGGSSSGKIHVLRSDLIMPEAMTMLRAVASVVLVAVRGSIGQQIDVLTQSKHLQHIRQAPVMNDSSDRTEDFDTSELEFFNGTGGFANNGAEYVIALREGETTPAPWINVIANPSFGFQVSALGSGHVWSENSRENQLTAWSNDPVTDPSGEAIWLNDLDSGQIWTPTALPIRDKGLYVVRHGFGYTRFEHSAHGIQAAMDQFVPLDDPVRITRLTLRNTSTRTRRLSVTAYAEWVLGGSRSQTSRHIITGVDVETGSIFARNPFSNAFSARVAFADLGAETTSYSADRAEVLGIDGNLASPAGIGTEGLSGRTGPALDPCAALQRRIELAPGGTIEILFLLGQADTEENARSIILRHRKVDPSRTLVDIKEHWASLLGAVQVKTPDRAMDIMLNGWLLYQTTACRIWARSGFYQASGAYGFRDQLQDGMALAALRPEMTRTHLLRAAGRQFKDGDVQHWWLPHSGQGVRTRISDDRVWLGHTVAHYVSVSGDTAILDEQVPFLEGPNLLPGVHDDFFTPNVSPDTASIFEHCARGIDQAIKLTGENGMPLIGTGDWNDGMNRVGENGQGTSVWLGWLLIATIKAMLPHADTRDTKRASRWRSHAANVKQAIETNGWDGEWYRRGTYDDGTQLGSSGSPECRIDSIAQSWAVLSSAADPDRAVQAMASMAKHLVQHDPGLALLFAPPFDISPQDPGYIKGYPPGIRENGGQYSHAAMWAIMAYAHLGNGSAAGALFAMLNPVNHALTPADASRYKVEPYVVAADVYSVPPHTGRGGWTWYTGSSAWMYRAGVESILGLTFTGREISLNPCIPKEWPQVEMTVAKGDSHLRIVINNPKHSGAGIGSATLDGVIIHTDGGRLKLQLPKGDHKLVVELS